MPHTPQEKDWKEDWSLEAFDTLSHAYFEPGDKGYWDAIEFAKDFIKAHEAHTTALLEQKAREIGLKLIGEPENKSDYIIRLTNLAHDTALETAQAIVLGKQK